MIEISDAYYPVIYSRFSGETTLEDADDFYEFTTAQLARAVERDDRVVVFIDSLGTTRITPAVRKRFAEHSKEVRPDWERVRLGTIVLHDSILVRGAITAISWIAPRANDLRSCRNVAAGLEEVRELFVHAGLRVPGAVASLEADLSAQNSKTSAQ